MPESNPDEDPFREMRTMILLSLPYPPLPVVASRVEPDECKTDQNIVTTTHTFIARCLDAAAARNDKEANTARRKRQTEVFQRYLHALASRGFFEQPQGLYELYCEFSRQQIQTYFPEGHPLDLSFMPLSSICRGDPAHVKMAEYMAGQSILFNDEPLVTREDYLQREFSELILMHRHRMGHAMTPEERARLDKQEGKSRVEELD
jgi:hypothetical protein